MRATLRALAVGSVFAAVFAYVAVISENRAHVDLPATQISSMIVAFCLLLVLAINPILRLLRARPFSRQEIFLIFIMGSVPAGLPVYGCIHQVVPMIGALHNPEWNTEQSQWEKRIVPYLDEDLFLGASLFCARDVPDWRAFHELLVAASQQETPSPARRLWRLLSADAQTRVRLAAQGIDVVAAEEEKALAAVREALAVKRGVAHVSELPAWQVHMIHENLARHNRYAIVRAIRATLGRADLYDAKAFAGVALPAEAQTLLDHGIDKLLSAEAARLGRYLLEAAFPQHVRHSRFLRDQQPMQDYVRGLQSRNLQAWPVFIKSPDETWSAWWGRIVRYAHGQDGSLFGAVAWTSWLGPLCRWLLLALVVFVLFYALNELVFRQWYEREKVVFPIAKLSEQVLDSDGDKAPPIFREPTFWLGFCIAFLVLLYNGLIQAHWLEGLSPVNLRGDMHLTFRNTALHGLTGGRGFRFEIFFTCIGLAFLLPVEISLSAWLFFLVMKGQQLVAVWLGYGVDGGSFRADWYADASFMTAQGGGAMEVFGLVYLWRVRHQILAWIYRFVRPAKIEAIYEEEIKASVFPSALFFLASAGVLWFLRQGNVPWGMAIVTYLALLLLTVAMVRLVAECGIIAFQAWFGPFHVMKTFGLLRFFHLFAAKGLGTVLVLLSGFFLDLKTFLAPTLMNAKYLAVRNRISGRSFAGGIVISVLLTLAVSSVAVVAMSNDLGVHGMERWFFDSFPHWTFASASRMMSNIEGMATVNPSTAGWFSVGAAICGSLLYLRRFVFWLPHPIGLIMYVSPAMGAYWFSFFIAWVSKRAAIKYCTPEGYERTRSFFIGLILGEVLAVCLSAVLSIWGLGDMGITLNRN